MHQAADQGTANRNILTLRDTVACLQQLKTGLEQLRSTTETEFLDIGSKLQDFKREATNVAGVTLAAAETLSGDTIKEVTEELKEILDRISCYLQFNQDEAVQNTGLLQEVLLIIETLDSHLNTFKKIIKEFDFIAISTRIEAARLHQGGHSFDKLVTDINKLVRYIKEKWEHMQHRSRKIYATGTRQLIFIDNLKKQQYQEAGSVLSRIQHDLGTLEKEQADSLELTRCVSGKAENVIRKISEVVSSLQFHDIIRQVIEHVEAVLQELSDALAAGAGLPGDDGGAAFAAWLDGQNGSLAESCLLQKLHVEDSSRKIADAVSSISGNLGLVAAEINEMYRETSKVIHSADEGSSTMLHTVEEGIGGVSASLNGTVETSINLRQAIREVFEGVSVLVDFISDIEEIGSEVELLAQNGLINAARLGDEGAALSTLADAIQKLSSHTQANVAKISKGLQNVQELTNAVNVHTTSDEDRESAAIIVDQAQGALSQAVEVLGRINSRSMQDMKSVEECSVSLKNEIDTLIGNIRVGEVFEQGFERSLALFKTIFENFKALGITTTEGMSDDLERLRKNYSMQSEHDIHELYLNGDSCGPTADVTEASEDDDDNIELF